MTRRRWALTAAIALLCAVPPLMHASLATGQGTRVAAGLAACEVIAIGLIVLAGLPLAPRLAIVAGLAAITLLVQHSASGSLAAASAINHALIYGGLLALFAASLRRGRTDLVTQMAARTQGPLAPEMARYTRRVTWAWCAFFAAELLASALLYALAPVSDWSLFVNVLGIPMVGLMFAAEYAARHILLPHLDHVSIVQTIRAFRRQRDQPHAE